jgi:molybdopterin converting factor small subunit
MEGRVRLFASLREGAGRDIVQLELPDGAFVGDVLERLGALSDGIPVVMAVNHGYADADAPLRAGEEVARIPPVSGGSVSSLHVRVTDEPLALDPLLERVRAPQRDRWSASSPGANRGRDCFARRRSCETDRRQRRMLDRSYRQQRTDLVLQRFLCRLHRLARDALSAARAIAARVM